ncbi:MAG: hypothetical protein GC160_00175 [Acidobacteria bacterium]|nr:hypothetical protein [Acidobacteriota bacterium]
MEFGWIRRGILPALLFSIACLPGLQAQSHGYGFVGSTIGDAPLDGAFRYGLGAAWAVFPHVTFGGEIGRVKSNGGGLIASGNVGVHLRRRAASGFDPFVTGGLTGAKVYGETAAWTNVGGGVNYWFQSHLALRGEFRTYRGGSDRNGFSELRFGISIR